MFKVLGTTDEVTTCDCCGRTGLKSTVALDLGGETAYFGVQCAAKATQYAPAAITRAARSADKAARDAAEVAKAAAFRVWAAWLREKTGASGVFEGIQALGGMAKAREMFRADGN